MFDLVNVVPSQALQVVVDRIDPATETGLDRLERGWRVGTEVDGTPRMLAKGSEAILRFFSPVSGLGDLTLEPVSEDGFRPFSIRLNDWVARPEDLSVGTIRYQEVPFQEGWNRLAIYPENRSRTLTVRSIGLPCEAASSADPDARIETRMVGTPPQPVIEMPGGSRLEWVVSVPEQAVWKAQFKSLGGDALTARGELLLPDGKVEEVFSSTKKSGAFTEDLSRYRGKLVGLRLSVDGPPSARLLWLRAQLMGPEARVAREPASEEGIKLAQPNVIVILLDAARADAFGAYGSSFATPEVDALAAEGTRFDRAWAPSSWTGQSVPSLMTGRTPESLQIETWGDSISPEVPTLAERMGRAGYRTVMWSHHPMYKTDRSHQRGFDEFILQPDLLDVPSGEFLVEGDAPVFAWIHLLPPHGPYRPPQEFLGRYSDKELDPSLIEPQFLASFPVLRKAADLAPGDLENIHGRYGEMVSFSDQLVGRIVDELKAEDAYRDALVILLADHGEAFLEHGRFDHSTTLYREMIEVPWIVKWPSETRGFREVVTEPVSLLGLFSTLSSALGLSDASETIESKISSNSGSLLPLIFDDAPAPTPLWAFTRGASRKRHQSMPSVAVEIDGWKGIYQEMDDRVLLFRTTDDREEREDLSTKLPLRARWLRQLILAERHAIRTSLDGKSPEGSELEPSVSRDLEALGYL